MKVNQPLIHNKNIASYRFGMIDGPILNNFPILMLIFVSLFSASIAIYYIYFHQQGRNEIPKEIQISFIQEHGKDYITCNTTLLFLDSLSGKQYTRDLNPEEYKNYFKGFYNYNNNRRLHSENNLLYPCLNDTGNLNIEIKLLNPKIHLRNFTNSIQYKSYSGINPSQSNCSFIPLSSDEINVVFHDNCTLEIILPTRFTETGYLISVTGEKGTYLNKRNWNIKNLPETFEVWVKHQDWDENDYNPVKFHKNGQLIPRQGCISNRQEQERILSELNRYGNDYGSNPSDLNLKKYKDLFDTHFDRNNVKINANGEPISGWSGMESFIGIEYENSMQKIRFRFSHNLSTNGKELTINITY